MTSTRDGGEEPHIDTRGGAVFHGDVSAAGDVIGRDKYEIHPDIARDVKALENPYLGLRPFTYADRERFAGREECISAAVKLLVTPGSQRSLLFVTGASGSGKSSFAQAGLVPALEGHYRRRRWTLGPPVTFRPSRNPISGLTDALVQLGLPRDVAFAPRATIGNATAFTAFLTAGNPPGQVNLVVIDQFEELFTQSDEGEREALIAVLSELAPFTTLHTHFIVTLRSDYLGELFPYKELYEVAKQSVDLREMDQNELRESIQRPLRAWSAKHASYAQKEWEPGLVDELASQAAPAATYLPLLQLTLQELWRGGRLTLAAYREMGGSLASAIRNRATAVLEFVDYDRRTPATPRPDTDRATTMRLLLDLVQVSVESAARPDVRRRRVRDELERDERGRPSAERVRLVSALVDARLLSVAHQDGVDYVDIVHESLIANWDRLRQAIAGERLALQQRARFEQAEEEWLENGRAEDYLLTGVRLAEARVLNERHDIALRDREASSFFELSESRDRERREAELQEQRRINQLLEARRAEADRQREIALGRELAAKADLTRRQQADLLTRSVLLAIEAERRLFALGQPSLEADQALREGLRLLCEPVAQLQHKDRLGGLVFSPDGSCLATAEENTAVHLWDCDSWREIIQLPHHGEGELTMAFSPDGSQLASAGSPYASWGQVKLWDLSSPENPRALSGTGAFDLAFSPDGSRVAAATRVGPRVWDATTGEEIVIPSGPPAQTVSPRRGPAPRPGYSDLALSNVLFVGSDKIIVSWILADNVRQIDVPSGDETIKLHFSKHLGVAAYTRDGRYLAHAIGEELPQTRVIEVDTGEVVFQVANEQTVDCLAFSPNDFLLAAGGFDRALRVWEVDGGKEVARIDCGGRVKGIAFSADSRSIAVTIDRDRRARVWRLPRHNLIATWSPGIISPPFPTSFSVDGAFVALGDASGRDGVCQIRIIELPSGNEVRRLEIKGQTYDLGSLALGPGGVLAVSGGYLLPPDWEGTLAVEESENDDGDVDVDGDQQRGSSAIWTYAARA